MATDPPLPRSAIEVPGNRWDLLDAGTPARAANLTVSVCIPTRNGGAALRRTLRMLSLQTFPMSRLQIVVADDGSDPPFTVDASSLPYELVVAHQERNGFGAGRARNLAASRASGDVLLFLDGDVIPEVGVIDDYVSWIQRSSWSVPMGFSRFVDLSDFSDAQLREALLAESVDQLVDGVDVDSQEYREPYLRRTSDLTIDRPDIFRVFVAATFAVTAEFFWAVGGFRELGVRGIEDIDLGYRLVNQGALLVPARSAQHWHQGPRTMSGARIAQIRSERQPFAERLLPVGGFRGDHPLQEGPVAPVCRFVAHVDDPDALSSATAQSVRQRPPEDIQLADPESSEQRHAFADVILPPNVTWGEQTGALLEEMFARSGVGTLKLIGDAHPDVTIRRRRATERSRGPHGETDPKLAEELFGLAVALASAVGIVADSGRRPAHRSIARTRWAKGWQRLRRLGRELVVDHPPPPA